MELRVSTEPVAYPEAIAAMQERVAEVKTGQAAELIWLLEHPALYTAGTSAKRKDLLQPEGEGLPVFTTGRGGQYTYHGPGQRIGYFILDLKRRTPDIRAYVKTLEQIIIDTLSGFNVNSFTRESRIGVWVETPSGEAKIAALGVRVQQGITSHGIAINRCPDLGNYKGIIPCGINDYGVSSLWQLGVKISSESLDEALIASIKKHFPENNPLQNLPQNKNLQSI
jgi:lipoyl(octanoyl) transferase